MPGVPPISVEIRRTLEMSDRTEAEFSIQENSDDEIQGLREHDGVSEATHYNWKTRYGGMDVLHLRRLKDVEVDDRR